GISQRPVAAGICGSRRMRCASACHNQQGNDPLCDGSIVYFGPIGSIDRSAPDPLALAGEFEFPYDYFARLRISSVARRAATCDLMPGTFRLTKPCCATMWLGPHCAVWSCAACGCVWGRKSLGSRVVLSGMRAAPTYGDYRAVSDKRPVCQYRSRVSP